VCKFHASFNKFNEQTKSKDLKFSLRWRWRQHAPPKQRHDQEDLDLRLNLISHIQFISLQENKSFTVVVETGFKQYRHYYTFRKHSQTVLGSTLRVRQISLIYWVLEGNSSHLHCLFSSIRQNRVFWYMSLFNNAFLTACVNGFERGDAAQFKVIPHRLRGRTEGSCIDPRTEESRIDLRISRVRIRASSHSSQTFLLVKIKA